MDQENTPTTPTPTPQVSPEVSTHFRVGIGVIVGILIFATILITAMYVAFPDGAMPTGTPVRPAVPAASTTEPQTDPAAAALSIQGTSDEIADIEADLNATDFNSFGDIDKI